MALFPSDPLLRTGYSPASAVDKRPPFVGGFPSVNYIAFASGRHVGHGKASSIGNQVIIHLFPLPFAIPSRHPREGVDCWLFGAFFQRLY